MQFDRAQFETEFDHAARHRRLMIEHELRAAKALADGLIETVERMSQTQTVEANAERLLTRQELWERLQVSESTIRKLEKRGMPVVRVGSVLRFDYADVKAWCLKQPAPTRKKPSKSKAKV